MISVKISITEEMQAFLKTYHNAGGGKDAKALFELANYYVGKKDEKLQKEAFSLYQKSAKLGYTEGMFGVGVCYELGIGTPKNSKKAISWYSKAEINITEDLINNPDPVGDRENELIKIYLNNEELINAFLDAAEESRKQSNVLENDTRLADEGDAEAQYRMGRRYLDGHGVEKDEKKAYEFFRKSAEQDCESAVIRMMDYYNIRKDYDNAVVWYRRYTIIRIKWRNKRLGW